MPWGEDDVMIEPAPPRAEKPPGQDGAWGEDDILVARPDPVYQSAALKFAKDDALSGAQAGPESLPLPARLKAAFPEYTPKPEHEALYQEEYAKWRARKPEYDLARELGKGVAATPGQENVPMGERGYVNIPQALQKMSPDMRRAFVDSARAHATEKERGYVEKGLELFGRDLEGIADSFGSLGRNLIVPQGDPQARGALRAARGIARSADAPSSEALAGLADIPLKAAGILPDALAGIVAGTVAGPVGVAGFTAARTAGSRLDEFEDAGFKPELARPMALATGAVEGAIETISMPLKMIPGFDVAKKAALGELREWVIKRAGKFTIETFKEGVIEELSQEGSAIATKKLASMLADEAPDISWKQVGEELKKAALDTLKNAPAFGLLQGPAFAGDVAASVQKKYAAEAKERAVTGEALDWGQKNPEALKALLEAKDPGSRSSSKAHKVPWATEPRAVREQAVQVLREQAQIRANEAQEGAIEPEAAPEPAQPEIVPPEAQEQAPAPVQQEEAQAPVGPEAPPIVTKSKQKPLHEMGPDELAAAVESSKADEAGSAVEAFGEAGAKEYERLQRIANSSTRPRQEVEAAEKKIGEMEDGLSEAQQRMLFGMDLEYGPEEAREYKRALADLDDSSPEKLGWSLQWAVSQVGSESDPAKMSHRERVRYAQLRHANEIIKERGWNPQSVSEAAVRAAAARFSDPEDARAVLGRFIKQEQVQPEQRKPEDAPLRARVDALAPENRADLVREIANMPEADRAARIDDLLQRVYEGEVDPVTNLPSRRVFQTLEKEGKLKPFKMASDIVGLGAANDKVDYAFGDALLQVVAATNKDALLDTARWGGDELMSHGDTAEILKERGDKLNHFLANKSIRVVDSSGNVRTIRGAHVVFGIGRTTQEAAENMEYAKEKARETGVRPAKGELPRFMDEKDKSGGFGPVKLRDSGGGRARKSAPPPEGWVGGTEPIRPGDQQAQVKRKGFEKKPEIQAREEAPRPKRKGFQKLPTIQAAQAKKPAPVPRPPDSDTTLKDGVAGKAKNPQQILADASRRFGVPIGKKFTHSAKNMGIYDRYQRVVRLAGPHSANLYVASHEIAHHIDDKYKITQSMPSAIAAAAGQLDYDPNAQRPSEGFAEFIAKKLDGREMKGAAAKVNAWFDRYLAGNPDLRAKLEESHADIEGWQGLDAESREKGTRTTEEYYQTMSFSERVTQKRQRLERALTDDIAIFTDVTEDVNKARKEAGLPELSEGERADKGIKAVRGAGNAWANRAYERGVWNPETGEQIAGVRGLKQIVKETTSAQLEHVVQFMRARHSRDVWATGRNPGMSRRDARVIYDKHKDNKQIVGWADEIVRFRKAFVDVAEQLGMKDEKEAKAIRESWVHTVSLKRAKDERLKGVEGGRPGSGSPFKRMSKRGSGEPVMDPLAVLMRENNVFYALAEKHIKDKMLIENIRSVPGMGKWMAKVNVGQEPKRVTFSEIKEQIEAAGGDVSMIPVNKVFEFYRQAEGKESDAILPYINPGIDATGKPNEKLKGQIEYYQFLDNGMELYHTLKAQEKETMGLALKVMNAASRLKRSGAVSWRLGFSTLSNPFRDLITTAIQTKNKAFEAVTGTLYNYAAGGPQLIYRAAGGDMNALDKMYKDYGLESAHFMGTDLAAYRADIDRATNDPVQKKLYRIATTPAEWKHYAGRSIMALPAAVEAIGNIVESAPRRAEFKQILEKSGVSMADIEAGKPIALKKLIPAMLAAKEVTTNFQQGGSWTKKYSLIHAFTNAQAQGYVQPVQRFKEHKVRFALRGVMGLTVPTFLYWYLFRKDDEERKEMPGWLKYGFWHIPGEDGKVTRVPRPFEIGTVFSGGPEAIFDYIHEKDPKEADRFLESFAPDKGTLLRMAPDLFVPIVEGLLNYDAFRNKQIVGRDKEKLENKDQFYEYNTSFSKWLGFKMDASPAKIDHVIRQYTGGLGTDILKIPDEGPDKALALSRIEARTERGASIDDFYASKDAVERAYNSGGKLEKAPRKVIAEKHKLDAIDDLMAKTRDYIQTLPDKDERYKAQRWITALARAGMGREELSAYPNPLKSESLPPALQEAVDKWLITRADNVARPKPIKSKNLEKAQREWEILRDDNLNMLKDMGVDMDRLYKLFVKSERSTKDDLIRFRRVTK